MRARSRTRTGRQGERQQVVQPADVQKKPCCRVFMRARSRARTVRRGERQQVLQPVDVVGAVGHRRHQVPLRHPPPAHAVVRLQQRSSQLPAADMQVRLVCTSLLAWQQVAG